MRKRTRLTMSSGSILKVYPSGVGVAYVSPPNLGINSYTDSSSRDEQVERAIEAHGIEAVEALAATERGRVLMGLVNVLPTRDNPPKRSPQGLSGITPKGRRFVKEGIFLLQRDYGNHNLGFYTCTIPELAPQTHKRICKAWPVITTRFIEMLKRKLSGADVSTELVYVTEVQPGRLAQYNKVGLHLHIVFVARGTSPDWVLKPADFDKLWGRALSNAVGHKIAVPYAGTIQPVTRSVEGELGKYMSKGADICREVTERGLSDYLPPRYWGMSDSLKLRIKDETVLLTDKAPAVIAAMKLAPELWTVWTKDIQLELDTAFTWTCATVFQLTQYGSKRVRALV